ncbi:MAG: 3-deoxy-manno-octulosonate cytidylyltransferase [Candidatus Omnitrophica bacterium]|nr:3-deoxy-manno-octulosonate cytidylyltransferase [Candidatus Omnitrophota bacterium]
MSSVVAVIPARWASTRFPGKVLAPIQGMPMIQHVWQRVTKSRLVKDVIVACDDQRVLDAAKAFGAKAVMTSAAHESGTDRIAEAIANIPADIVVNVQGDEPLIEAKVIDALVQTLIDDPQCPMATAIRKITKEEFLKNPNVVKVVVDDRGYALYFSRAAIPFNRDQKNFSTIKCYQHLGLYAYRKDFLKKFSQLSVSDLEKTEKLEQLRVLERGYKIKTVLTDYETVGVDTPEDLERVSELMRNKV